MTATDDMAPLPRFIEVPVDGAAEPVGSARVACDCEAGDGWWHEHIMSLVYKQVASEFGQMVYTRVPETREIVRWPQPVTVDIEDLEAPA